VVAQGASLDSGRHAGREPASTGSTLTGEQDGVGQRVEGAGGALGAPVRQIDRPVNEQAPHSPPPPPPPPPPRRGNNKKKKKKK